MIISYNWLRAYMDLSNADGQPITPDELAKRMHAAGIDVERVELFRAGEGGLTCDDAAIHIRVSRELSDWTSMMWTVNELCGILKRPISTSQKYGDQLPDSRWTRYERDTELFLDSKTDRCRLVAGKIIGKIAHKKTPDTIRDAVIVNGCKPTDAVTDLAWYAVRTLGQPMLVLDREKLPSVRITVCESKNAGNITVDGSRVEYQSGDLVLTADDQVISIGLFLADDRYCVRPETKAVLILTAVMDPDTACELRWRHDLRDLNTLAACAGSNHASAMKELTFLTSLYYQYADAHDIEAPSIYNKYDFQKSIIFTTLGEINSLLGSGYLHTELVPAVSNAGVSMTVLEPVYDENGGVHVIGVCEPSEYVTQKTKIGVKFSSFRSRRNVCDVAQLLISLTGCSRIGNE